jgi:hypothetical protein
VACLKLPFLLKECRKYFELLRLNSQVIRMFSQINGPSQKKLSVIIQVVSIHNIFNDRNWEGYSEENADGDFWKDIRKGTLKDVQMAKDFL